MDGRFVPNLTFGPATVEAVRRATTKPIDVHLMVIEPERYLDDFARAGADHLLVHAEPSATIHLHRVLSRVRELGKQAGAVLDPATPLGLVEHVLHLCDIVLVMTVNPGFGGQAFLPEMLPKIRDLRRYCARRGLAPRIAVDGGQDGGNAARAIAAGADFDRRRLHDLQGRRSRRRDTAFAHGGTGPRCWHGPAMTGPNAARGGPPDLKRLAAVAAVGEVETGMVLGLGSGSTAALALEELAARIARERLPSSGSRLPSTRRRWPAASASRSRVLPNIARST